MSPEQREAKRAYDRAAKQTPEARAAKREYDRLRRAAQKRAKS